MTSSSVLVLSLRYGAIVTAVIAVVGAIVGYLVAAVPGLASALIGAVLAAVFMGLTAGSVVLANRVAPGAASVGLNFGIIAGTWLIKFVMFIVVVILVSGQPWLRPYLFFGAVIAAVFGSLVADGVALQRARVPYVGDIELPGNPDAVHPQERR
jgi:hypothetical protein